MYVLIFDEDIVYVDGLFVYLMLMMFNVIIGVVIVVMILIVGVFLIFVIMVFFVVIGMWLGKSFNVVIVISVCVGFLGMLLGLISLFYLDIFLGVIIILVFIVLFLIINIIKWILVVFRRKNN